MATLVVLGFSGCGDDDESTSETAAAALTQEEYVAQGNEICAAGNQEIDDAAGDAFGESQPSPDEAEQFATETVIPSIESQINDLEALPAPEGDEEQVTEMLDAANAALASVQDDPSLLFSEQPFAEVNELLTDYGLTECAS